MLNRTPLPTYGFDTDLLHDGATLILSTPEFPCRITDPAHLVGGDAFIAPALTAGLHLLAEADSTPPPSSRPWLFRLPSNLRRAGVFGDPEIKMLAGEQPTISPTWWSRAVMNHGTCQLITTTGLITQTLNRRMHTEVIRASGGHRLVAATIPVGFF